MPLETKKERNGETTDAWETLLARRLADDLDAFLNESDDSTFLFADPTIGTRRAEQRDKRPRYKALATVAASLALLGGLAATTRFYVASPKIENVAEKTQTGDASSLIAWSVESLNESEWARNVETKLASADVFELYASLGTKDKTPEETRLDVAQTADGEEIETAENDSNEWFSVEKLTDVAVLEPLKYEPFLQAVAATLL